MLHRIREAVATKDSLLSGMVKVDETYRLDLRKINMGPGNYETKNLEFPDNNIPKENSPKN